MELKTLLVKLRELEIFDFTLYSLPKSPGFYSNMKPITTVSKVTGQIFKFSNSTRDGITDSIIEIAANIIEHSYQWQPNNPIRITYYMTEEHIVMKIEYNDKSDNKYNLEKNFEKLKFQYEEFSEEKFEEQLNWHSARGRGLLMLIQLCHFVKTYYEKNKNINFLFIRR